MLNKPMKIVLTLLGILLAFGLTAHVVVNYVVPFAMKMHGS